LDILTNETIIKMRNLFLAILLITIFYPAIAQKQSDNAFVTSPYLQIGSAPNASSLQLLWHATDENSSWIVEHKTTAVSSWTNTGKPLATKITTTGIAPHIVYRTALTGLVPGSTFTYRVLKNNKEVFSSQAQAPRSADQPFRFVVFGDIGAGTPEAKQIANGVYNAKADLVVVPGDIVYDYGLISEYRSRFWPIYNTDKVDSIGVPLMRSVPFVGAVGNHDADSRDLDKAPDALAYYHYWDQPLNGPVGKEGGAFVPVLTGSESNKKAFMQGAGNRYPRMTNFSFNYGNAHYTFLDADTYVDWTDKELTGWVTKDLADAKNAVWRFVVYHHPGFNSSREHFEQQQMRLLSPIFEAGKVDIVFNGHVHNYQRSFPMRFAPDNKGTLLIGGKDSKSIRGRVITGKWTLDKIFDGKTKTIPDGVIYIVTGAGGQNLYNPEQQNDPDSWQKFTDKFISTVHSFSVIDVNGKKLTLRQLTASGKELDAIEITKQ
jgi:predicted phosphodiesterase